MPETIIRIFRNEKIGNLSKSLISHYICTIGNGGKLGFKRLTFLGEDGDEENISIKDIFVKDFIRIQNLFSILDDLVTYDYIKCGKEGQMYGFWSRFNVDNFNLTKSDDEADAPNPTDMVKLNLSKCDQTIRLIYCVLGANEYINEKERQSETGKKYTFGSLLHDEAIDTHINDGRGRYDSTNSAAGTLLQVLLQERNKWAIHPKTATDSEPGSNTNMAMLLEDCRNKTAIVLTALLHIVDYHYDALDHFFEDFFSKEEARNALKEEVPAEGAAFDPEAMKREYVQSLLTAANDELRRNVGNVGNIANTEGLKLMNLKMQLVWKDEHPVVDDMDTEQDDDYTQNVRSVELKQITAKADAEDRVNVILGNPGSGKSTLLTQLQKNICSQWLEGEIDALFPVSLVLKGVGKDHFIDATRDSVGERLFSVIEPMCKEGKVVFILDGLNELPLQNPKNYCDSLCTAIRSTYAHCHFYISGRIHEFNDYSRRWSFKESFQSLAECSIYQMREISPEDVTAYFKELKASDASTNTFFEWIENAKLMNLLASPLNFSMIAKMVMHKSSQDLPVENINNRGELLDLFLKSTLHDKGILTTGIEGETFRLLQLLAVALDETNNHPISCAALSAYCKDLYPDDTAFNRELILMQSLEEPCRLNVLSKTKDVNGKTFYTFAIDTFQEFFHARHFAVSFVGNVLQGINGIKLKECLSAGFDVQDGRRFEMLRLALELIAGGRIQKETAASDGVRFVKDFLQIYNKRTGTIAELAASLPASSPARALVERVVLKRMLSYREAHETPAPESDKEELTDIVKGAVKLSTNPLFTELFNYYWMSATGMIAPWEFGFSFQYDVQTFNQLRTAIVSNCTDPIKFYDYLHKTVLDILPLYSFSNSFLNITRNLLFSELTTYRQKLLYNHIKERYAYSCTHGLYDRPDHLLSQDANLLLMYMDDPKYINEKLDLAEMKATGTRIGIHTLMRLLQKYDDKYIPRIIFQNDFFELLEVGKPKGKTDEETKNDKERQRRYKIASIIRFFLFRNCFPQELLDYLSPEKNNGIASLNEHERLPILDLLPISELRAYKEQYYDEDVFQFLDENDDEEESVEGLHYRIFSKEKDCTRVWIRNIATPLKGLTALIGSSQTEITDDSLVISRQYRFKISSPAIISRSGTMKVSGTELLYVTPFDDAEIIFTTFDDSIAKLLSETETAVVGESQVCSVEKTFESQPKAWRVLTLKGAADIFYYGDMQFAQGDERVNIDKTIRANGYRFEPQLFRRLEALPVHSCTDVPYLLMGSSSTKVWVVTDKLMNYDRYKNAGAIVRPKGHQVNCRFIEAHPFTERFVELTFRSAVPFDFPQEGMLLFSHENQEEASVPYIFCHCAGTRSIVRIADSNFVKAISDDRNRIALMAGYFRIGRFSLLLDYVEIFSGSERLSVWTLQRLSNESFPTSGNLEVGADTSFQKQYQLTFTNETRRQSVAFNECKCLCYDVENNFSLFAADKSMGRIAAGLFMTNDNDALRLKIAKSYVCHWMAQSSFVSEMQIPMSGILSSPDIKQGIRYLTISKKGSSSTALFFTTDAELDFSLFKQVWESVQSLAFTSNDGSIVNTGFRKKDPVVRMEDMQLIQADAPAGFNVTECPTDNWCLSVFCPIRNEMDRTLDAVVKTIKVHRVPYTVVSGTEVIIRKPVTEFQHLYVNVDDSDTYFPISVGTAENNNPFGIDYCKMTLRGESETPIELNPNGEIGFYAKQSSGFVPVSVGYRRVLEVVDLNKPRTVDPKGKEHYRYYPSQICAVLMKELSDLDVINEELVKFFADHSCAYMLLTDPHFLEKIQNLDCEQPLINLCTVLSVEKDGRVSTYSWLTNDKFPSMDVVDSHTSTGDLVFVERNHKITPAQGQMIAGNAFPAVTEIPPTDEIHFAYETMQTTWQEEELRVRKHKDNVATLISFLADEEPTTPLSVVLPPSGLAIDWNGIIVTCSELPNFTFRLNGASEASFEALKDGGSIPVLPSKKLRDTFNPYRFTQKGTLSVNDAALTFSREALYCCIVKKALTRKENTIGVFIGDRVGSFLNETGNRYKNGQLVHLQLKKTNKSGWCVFSTAINLSVKVGQVNISIGDVLDDVIVTNNGTNNSFIEVEYRLQDGVITGSVDNNSIPHFSSRMMNGLYRPGLRITLRVSDIKEDANAIRFELGDKTVAYPFGPGIYDCIIHRNYANIKEFDWRMRKDGQWAWASINVQGKRYTVEIPKEEKLEHFVSHRKHGGGVPNINIFDYLLSCGQEYASQVEILGFTNLGDPIVSLRTLNMKRVKELPDSVSFPARVLYADPLQHIILWHYKNLFGTASIARHPRINSEVEIVPQDSSENRPFRVRESRLSDNVLTVGSVVKMVPGYDEDLLDRSMFVARLSTDMDSLPETKEGQLFLCRHSKVLPDYWIEFFITQGKPINAQIVDCQGGEYTITFLPDIDYNWKGLAWEKETDYSVTITGYTRNYIMVQYFRDDHSAVVGAIYSGGLDTLSWRESHYPIGTTLLARVQNNGVDYLRHAVLFVPKDRIVRQFPFGLQEDKISEWRVFETNCRGDIYICLCQDEEVRYSLNPFEADWSVLPSGKPVPEVGDMRSYKVSLANKPRFKLMLQNNPWKENEFCVRALYSVTIRRFDDRDVLVEYNRLYGEIPRSEFSEDDPGLNNRIGQEVNARLSFVNPYSHVLCFTLQHIEEDVIDSPLPKTVSVNDVIVATVKKYADEFTPLLEWEGQEIHVTPSQAAFLAEKPWIEKVAVEDALPIGTACKVIVTDLDESHRIRSVKPCNLGSPSFFKERKKTEAVVLYCSDDGVYAKTVDDAEHVCLVFIPKNEIIWGRVYTAANYFQPGTQIFIQKRPNSLKPNLISASIKRVEVNPQIELKADTEVTVVIERILHSKALNVICNGKLHTQISVEDTTWNPDYILGKQAKLTQRFHVGDTLTAIVEEGGVNQDIRLSLREKVNPWTFGQVAIGDEWPAYIVKILDEEHFVVRCRGLFIRVSNKTGLKVVNQSWVSIRIREIFPDEPYASAILLSNLPNEKYEEVPPVNAEQAPFHIGQRIPVRITRIHHHLMEGDYEDYLEFSPMANDSMRGVIYNFELAWKTADRTVDQYKVGDETSVVITGFGLKKMTGSLREANWKESDPRTIEEIVKDCSIVGNVVKERIPVTITDVSHKIFNDTKAMLHYVNFSYGDYHGRIVLNGTAWSAVQEPDTFFRKGQTLRVQVTGKVEYYDKISHQQKVSLKATIPYLREVWWKNVADKKGECGQATILSMNENELFVLFASSFVVKMTREQIIWESTLPLSIRYKVGQIIPVLVKDVSVQEHRIELDSKALQDNPYQADMGIAVDDIRNGVIVAEGKDNYYLDISLDNGQRVTCALPFSGFPYPWHRNYVKGDIVPIVIDKIDLTTCEIVASRKDERLSAGEMDFKTGSYYWFKVFGYQCNGIVLDFDGYQAYMDWEDAWLVNVSDPSDMYPIGMKCLLRVKSIDGNGIFVHADYDWKQGLIGLPSKFQAEVCLRNPANGIVMRMTHTDSLFCLVTRYSFSEPLMSDILSYIPQNKYYLRTLFKKDKVYAYFGTSAMPPSEEDYADVQPGMVVSGTVKHVAEKYVIVLYKSIQILVDKNYVGANVKNGDPLTIRITHHEHYLDSGGKFVSKKLLGSAYAVYNDPFRELPIGKQVSGLVTIPTTKKGKVIELRVDLPHKGTVIGKLLTWGKIPVYRGQRIVAYVSYHHYETKEIRFTLSRPDMSKLAVGSIVKATVLKINDGSLPLSIDVSFSGSHFELDIPYESIYWGKNPYAPFLKVGARFNMAITALNEKGDAPATLSRRALYPDNSLLTNNTVHGEVVAHHDEGCLIMAGTTLGFMPIREMSHQRCELWEQLFPVRMTLDVMVRPADSTYPSIIIYSYRKTIDNPFDQFDPQSLFRKTVVGEIVRATQKKAVARLKEKQLPANIEVLIPSMRVFSDGFQTIIPQPGTIVHLKISKVEKDTDGKWLIEAMVIPNR